eukprot:COSAG01_NODE_716_length_14085_cov_18.724010_10_plen_218_part_00
MAGMRSSALPLAEPYVAVPLCREDTKMGKYFYQVVWQDRHAGAPQIESWRRYSEFRKLRAALQQLLGPEVGSLPFPPKRVLRGSAAEVVAERRDALQAFLRALLVEQRLAVPAPPAAPAGEAETEAEPEAPTAANLLWEFFSPPKVRCPPPTLKLVVLAGTLGPPYAKACACHDIKRGQRIGTGTRRGSGGDRTERGSARYVAGSRWHGASVHATGA